MRRLLLLVAVTGCFSKPSFGGDAGPSDGRRDDAPVDVPVDPPADAAVIDYCVSAPGLTFTAAPTEVTWPAPEQLRLRFAASGTAMPDRVLLGNNVSVLSAAQNSACAIEDRVGLALFPAWTASPASGGGIPLATLTEGAAYAEYVASFTRSFTCTSGQPSAASASSRFRLFPDGRIVRNDDLDPTSVALSENTGCNCTGADATPFYLTSFIGLAHGAFHEAAIGNGAQQPITALPAQINNADAGCLARTGGGAVAIAWHNLTPRTRIRNLIDDSEIAFVYDLAVDATIPVGPVNLRSTIMLTSVGASCAPLLAAARASAAPDLAVSSSFMEVMSPDDARVYTSSMNHDGTVTITNIGASDVRAGFVVTISLDAPAIRTSRAHDRVIWHRQMLPTNGALFHIFFRDSLPMGQSITLMSEPACP